MKVKSKLPSFWQLKMRSQIFFLTVLLMLLVLGLILISYVIHKSIVLEALYSGSENVLSKQTKSFQTIGISEYVDYIETILTFTSRNMAKMNRLFQYSLKRQYTIEPAIKCPLKQDPSMKIDAFCFTPQGTLDLQTYTHTLLADSYVNFTSLVTSLIYELGSIEYNQGYYFALDTSDQLCSYWPQVVATPNYFPITRPWFISQKQLSLKGNSSGFSPLYQFEFVDEITYGITQTQELSNGSTFLGVIASDLNLQMVQYMVQSYPDVNIVLLYQNDTIIFQNLGNNEDVITNNNTIYYKNKNANSEIVFIPNSPFKIVLYGNQTYQKIQYALSQETMNIVSRELFYQIYDMLLLTTLSLFLQYLCIKKIMKPLDQIHLFVHSKKNKLSFYKVSDNQLIKLHRSVALINRKFQYLSKRKHRLCRALEYFKYYRNQMTDIYDIRLSAQMVPEQNLSPTTFRVKEPCCLQTCLFSIVTLS